MLRQAERGLGPGCSHDATNRSKSIGDEADTSVQVGVISVNGDDIIKNILWLFPLSFLVIQVLETIH